MSEKDIERCALCGSPGRRSAYDHEFNCYPDASCSDEKCPLYDAEMYFDSWQALGLLRSESKLARAEDVIAELETMLKNGKSYGWTHPNKTPLMAVEIAREILAKYREDS